MTSECNEQGAIIFCYSFVVENYLICYKFNNWRKLKEKYSLRFCCCWIVYKFSTTLNSFRKSIDEASILIIMSHLPIYFKVLPVILTWLRPFLYGFVWMLFKGSLVGIHNIHSYQLIPQPTLLPYSDDYV